MKQVVVWLVPLAVTEKRGKTEGRTPNERDAPAANAAEHKIKNRKEKKNRKQVRNFKAKDQELIIQAAANGCRL